MDGQETEKYLSGNWRELIEAAVDLYELQDFLAFKADFLKAQLGELQADVENGVVEFKRSFLHSTFDFIENLKFDTRGFNSMGRTADLLRYGTYMALIQKMIASGKIKIRRPKSGGEMEAQETATKPVDSPTSELIELKEIIAAISEKVQKQPQLKTNSFVKQILLQVNLYKKELADFQRLAASVPKEKSAGLAVNFKKRVAEITESANENYHKLMDELEPKPQAPAVGLISYDLKKLIPLYESQAKAFYGLAGRLMLVEKQRSGYREILLPLLPKREAYLGLINKELEAFTLLEPFEGGQRKATMEFTREIIRILQREADEAFR